MFKPFRLIFLLGAAFLTGLLFERQSAGEACRGAGGSMDAGLCRGVP